MSKFFHDTPAEAELGTMSGIRLQASAPGDTSNGWARHREPGGWCDRDRELYNVTADAHPIHIHEVVFEVVNRQDIVVFEDQKQVQINPASPPTPPEPGETGFKDTVIAYPGQVTRVRAQFNTPGQFVWHCHIVEHEDNEMMRPYRIGPYNQASRFSCKCRRLAFAGLEQSRAYAMRSTASTAESISGIWSSYRFTSTPRIDALAPRIPAQVRLPVLTRRSTGSSDFAPPSRRPHARP